MNCRWYQGRKSHRNPYTRTNTVNSRSEKYRIRFVMCLHNITSISGNPSSCNQLLSVLPLNFHCKFLAPMSYHCYCSACYPSQKRTIWTIKSHLRSDQHALVSSTSQDNKHLEDCITKNTSALKLYEAKNVNTGETILIYLTSLDCLDNCKNT